MIPSTGQSDDDDTDMYRSRTPPTNFSKPHPLPTLNGTSMFTTTTTTPTKQTFDETTSDEDSIEAAVQRLNTQKAAGGIQNIVNKQVGNTFQLPSQTTIPSIRSPVSEESSWSTASVTPGKKVSSTKGVQSLIQQQPLLTKKSSEPTWDDSRPLSADLKRNSFSSKTRSSTSSDESDLDEEKKSSTIVKSPFTNNILSNLVQTNIQPTETKTTGGIENLTKMMETIMRPPLLIQKQ